MSDFKVKISNSHVNNKLEIKTSEIINLLQDVEGIHVNNLKELTNYFLENNLGVFLMYRQVDIISKPKFSEEITLTTYPFETSPVSGYRHIYINDIKGNPLVKTTSFGAFVNLETSRPVRLPKEYQVWVNDQKRDPSIEILNRKISYDESKLKLVDKIRVRKSHIDRYNHVNNVHYVNFAINNLDNDNYSRIRVEYKKPFLINDEIFLYKYIENEKVLFVFKDEKETVYTVMEFSNIN